MQKRPVIGIPCDVKPIGAMPFHCVGDKYIHAVQTAVGDVVLLPSLGQQAAITRLLPLLDGVFLTGSPSNVAPEYYHGEPSRAGTLHDTLRDQTTLPLIRQIVAMGMPLLGVCRGFQEMNVAFGGSLHQHIQELPGMLDHREVKSDSMAQMYQDAHEIHFAQGSWLQTWLGKDHTRVNSLHQQGIKDLAKGLVVEATAPDGLIEAMRVTDAPGFAYGVQWHPEWLFAQKEASVALFQAFQNACVAYAENKAEDG